MIDGAERLGRIRVGQRRVERGQVVELGAYILRRGQRIQPAVERDLRVDIELAGRIVDDRLVAADDDRVALARALGRPEQIIEIGVVVPVAGAPFERVVVQIDMPGFVIVGGVGRIGEGRRQLIELQRVLEDRVVTVGAMPLVAFDHGVRGAQAHFRAGLILAPVGDHLVKRDAAWRARGPGFHDGMLRGDFGAEKMDRAEILQRRGGNDGGPKTLSGEFIDDQRAVGARNGPEKSGRCVADGLHLLGGDLEAEYVRDAGVVGATEKIAAVRREHETFRRGRAEFEPGDRCGRLGLHVGQAKHLNRLLAVHFADRG